MAKRKRLTPANPVFLDPAPQGEASPLPRAPIADVAREASATAAAEEMAQTLTRARDEGRMVISVPLDAVQLDYLVRDRVVVDDEDMATLTDSIARRGQQTPVELVDLGEGQHPRYGLISGWRRCVALRQLAGGPEAARFAHVQGLLRRPEEASDAYLAMIEENEIRVGLSYFERARIALKAVAQGVMADEGAALRAFYAGASRAKRSKIKSFITVVRELDGHLRFPGALGERLGLSLAQALEVDGDLAGRLQAGLSAAPPRDAEAEQSLIRREIAPVPAAAKAGQTRQNTAPPEIPLPQTPEAPVPRIALKRDGRDRLVLEGPGLDADFVAALADWLATRDR